MWDLDTIRRMNAAPHGSVTRAAIQTSYIYDIGGGKFALGNVGKKAKYVVRRVLTEDGRGRPRYVGVQARRPRISPDAVRIARPAASRALREALGL